MEVETLVTPILRTQNSIVQLLQINKGVRLQLHQIKSQQSKIFYTEIRGNQQFKPFQSYFDNIEELVQYIKITNNIKINYENMSIQILGKHPTKNKQNYKITQIKLKEKEKEKGKGNLIEIEDDFNYQFAMNLCNNQRQLHKNQLKHILRYINYQLKLNTNNTNNNNNNNIKKCQCKQIKKSQQKQNLPQPKQKQINNQIKYQLEQQIDRIKQMMSKKLGKLSIITMKQIQQIRQVLSLKIKNYQGINKQIVQLNKKMEKVQLYCKDISQIQPGQQDINLIAKVIQVKQYKKNLVKVILGDHTGIVNGVFKKKYNLTVGQSVILQKAIALVYRQHIELRLKNGRNINIQKSNKVFPFIQMGNYISLKAWVPMEN